MWKPETSIFGNPKPHVLVFWIPTTPVDDHPLVHMQLHDAFVRRMGEARAEADETEDRRGDQRKKRTCGADGDGGDGGGKLWFADANMMMLVNGLMMTPRSEGAVVLTMTSRSSTTHRKKDKKPEAQIRMRTQHLKSS